MIKHGHPPYLEASSAGDKRFSAFFARIKNRGFKSIEEIYQSSKIFEDGKPVINWRQAKGHKAVNQIEVSILYQKLWNEYIQENPHLILVLLETPGISDKFATPGSNNQATALWNIRKNYIEASCSSIRSI